MDTEPLLDRLIQLERSVGAHVKYRIMSPIEIDCDDALELQASAARIADFIGMSGFQFIVGCTGQAEGTAGHIDLATSGLNVFIEVDSALRKYPAATAATVCHELCHKWLQWHGLPFEDEVLTDVSCVFLGLGKIMLNGCESTSITSISGPEGTTTRRATQHVGYLDIDDVSFVYRVVCTMRGVPDDEAVNGLGVTATAAVRRSQGFIKLPPGLADSSRTPGLLDEAGQRQILAVQRMLAELDRHRAYIRMSLLEAIDAKWRSGHRILKNLRAECVAASQADSPDPALRYLRGLRADHVVVDLRAEMDRHQRELERMLKHTAAVGAILERNGEQFPEPASAAFAIVSCPHDGSKMRVPEGTPGLIVTCPTCKYRFAYSTAPVDFAAVQRSEQAPAGNDTVGRKWSLWQTVVSLVRTIVG